MKAKDQFFNAYGIKLTKKKHFEVVALLLCLELVLAFSYLGFIQLPPISLTTLTILVVVAAMYFGPFEAMAVGLLFGCASMWKATVTSIEFGDIAFSPFLSGQPLESFIMAVVTRVAFGLVAGLMFKWFFSKERAHRKLGISVIAVLATAVHALLVYACMVMFFAADEAQTTSSFDQALLLNNLILYLITIIVVLACDYLMRCDPIRRFFAATSKESVESFKQKGNLTTIITVVITLFCVLVCLHFMSRLVYFFTSWNIVLEYSTTSFIYSLLLQFAIGLAATFCILGLLIRWMQQYSLAQTLELRVRARENEQIANNYERFFVLEDNFESLYEVDLSDNNYVSYVKGEFYQNNVLDKLPAPADFFVDLRDGIDTVVYSEDRERLFNAITREAITQGLEKADRMEVFYRLVTSAGPQWFKLRIVYKDERRDSLIIGVFDAAEEMAAKEHLQQLVTGFVSEYELALIFNPETGQYDLLSDAGMLDAEDIESKSFDEANRLFGERYVHPDDWQTFCREFTSFGDVKNMIDVGESDSFEFRRRVGDDYLWYRAVFNRISEDEVLLGYKNCDSEITRERAQKQVIADFASVFVVNMKNDTYRFISRSEESDFADVGGGVYTETIRAHIAKVDPEYRAYWETLCNLDKIRAALTHAGRIEYEYPLESGEKRWRRCVIQALESENGVPTSFIMTFLVVDDTAAEVLELSMQVAKQKDEIEEDMQMIGGLASGYHALYYVNLAENFFRVYSLDGKRLPKAAAMVAQGGDPAEIFQRFAMSDLVHPDDKHLFLELNTPELKARLSHSKKLTIRFRRNFGGEFRWSEMDIIKYEDVDEPLKAFALGFADRDKEIRAEQEQQRQLRDALQAAEEANRSKTDFLFNMSHDIRTPLNAITGFTNMAIKYIDDKDKALDSLIKTQQSGNMLLSLVNNVLEVSRIESGHATLNEQPGDVLLSFVNIQSTLDELAQTKDIDLSFGFGEVHDRYVYADFDRCVRVFVNVISNAIKYTREGGRVRVFCEQVGAAKDGFARYRYVVADNGIGMSEEFQKHLFEQFSRENTSTVSGIQGTGLGLAVVKSFVDLMNGTIDVESKAGEGTTFSIVLPFRLQETALYTSPATGEVIPAGSDVITEEKKNFVCKRVLLVEDNELNREIAIDILEEEGLIVEEAGDGTVAVEMLREKGPSYYDFILMDIQMPQMNGYDATRAIRAMYPQAELPIIALSANAFEEDRAASRAAGMDDHVAKPIDIDELFSALARFLK